MLKVVEPITCRLAVEWEEHGIGWIDAEGYTLEDGSTVVYVDGCWEGKKVEYDPVMEDGEIIGFIPTKRKQRGHIGKYEPIVDKR